MADFIYKFRCTALVVCIMRCDLEMHHSYNDVIIFVGQLLQFCPINLSCLPFSGLNNGSAVRVPAAQMSTGSAGGGGENKVYFLLVGAACLGGGIYVSVYLSEYMICSICIKIIVVYLYCFFFFKQTYRTVTSDQQRYLDRMAQKAAPQKTAEPQPPGEQYLSVIISDNIFLLYFRNGWLWLLSQFHKQVQT